MSSAQKEHYHHVINEVNRIFNVNLKLDHWPDDWPDGYIKYCLRYKINGCHDSSLFNELEFTGVIRGFETLLMNFKDKREGPTG